LVDYKTYLASFGWLFFIAVCIVKLLSVAVEHFELASGEEKRYFSYYTAMPVLALFLGFATTQRNKVWRTGIEFWGNVIKNAPGKARAYNNYGGELSQKYRRFKDAIVYFKRAIAMDKNYSDPYNNLAVAYSNIGETEKAIEAYKNCLRIYPNCPEGYNNLASQYLKNDDYDEAEKYFKIALKLRPYYGKAFFNLGQLHMRREEPEKAWECFRNCCMKGDFDNAMGFETWGKVSLRVQKYDDAIFAYKKVIEYKSATSKILLDLGNAYFYGRRFAQIKQDLFGQCVFLWQTVC
jgi:tetratricopeptide (TPR) repeat protein